MSGNLGNVGLNAKQVVFSLCGKAYRYQSEEQGSIPETTNKKNAACISVT